MGTNTAPFKLTVASPCRARWEDMAGSGQVRFCAHCRKNVYNLSAMTTEAAAGLLKSRNGNLCARFYQRRDGTVLTENCPVGTRQRWRRIQTMIAGGLVTFLMGSSAIAGYSQGDSTDNSIRSFMAAMDEAADKVRVWCGLPVQRPQLLLGKIAIRPAPTIPPSPPAQTPGK